MKFEITFEIDDVLLFYFKVMDFDQDGELIYHMGSDTWLKWNGANWIREKDDKVILTFEDLDK